MNNIQLLCISWKKRWEASIIIRLIKFFVSYALHINIIPSSIRNHLQFFFFFKFHSYFHFNDTFDQITLPFIIYFIFVSNTSFLIIDRNHWNAHLSIAILYYSSILQIQFVLFSIFFLPNLIYLSILILYLNRDSS